MRARPGRPDQPRARRGLLRRLPGRERRDCLRPLLQPDPLVHPALPLGSLQRARHPPGGGGRLGARLQGRQRRHRRQRALAGRRRAGAAGHVPRLPPHVPRSARRDRTPSCSTSSTSRGRSPTRGGSSAVWREEIYRGLLANDIIGFHTTAYCRNFLHCCRELLELEVDYERGRCCTRARDLGPRLPAGDRRRPARSGRRLAEESPSTSASCCAPPRPPDPAGRSRRPVEERAPRLPRSTSSSSSTRSSASG